MSEHSQDHITGFEQKNADAILEVTVIFFEEAPETLALDKDYVCLL
jgi:hypothetical protein